MKAAQNALVELGVALGRLGYGFVTVTPETHHRVNARADRLGRGHARDLRDVFGWNRPFAEETVPSFVLELLDKAQALRRDGLDGEGYRSAVRFSTLGGKLYVHSSFPTNDADSVFFGPDTYRFCRLLRDRGAEGARVVDICCGSGAGGLSIASRAGQLILADVSARALDLARVNAELHGVDATVVRSDVLGDIDGDFDLVIANPPYMREDDAARTYRDGGGAFGEGLAARIVREALPRLRPGGRLLLYTGSAIVDGTDTFRRSVASVLEESALPFTYDELDPDVVGEELERPAYADVDRIAAVALDLKRGTLPL